MMLGSKVYAVVGRTVEERELVGETPDAWLVRGAKGYKVYRKDRALPRNIYFRREHAQWQADSAGIFRWLRSLIWG